MMLAWRRRLALTGLALYWPALFTLTHIPLPAAVQEAGMSDKTLHFVAYFLLVLLIWPGLQPYRPVRWNRVPAWLVLAAVTVYGALDEGLQGFVPGRSVDPGDFVADLTAAGAALGLLTVLPFWRALLWGTAGAVVAVLGGAAGDLEGKLPLTTGALHGLAFSLFTGLWLLYLGRSRSGPAPLPTVLGRGLGPPPRALLPWLIRAGAAPLALLLGVGLGALVKGRVLSVSGAMIALACSGLCIAAVGLSGRLLRRRPSP